MADFEILYRDVAALRAAQSLLSWDQQVLMPAGGASARAAHSQLIRRMIHERLTGEEMRRALEEALSEADPESDRGRSAAALARDLETETKLPLALVQHKARVSSEAYEVWKIAKAENDFAKLAPYLDELFDVARVTAEHLGYSEHPYDALINLYEYGATHASAASMFSAIKQPIVDLVRDIRENGRPIDDSALRGNWDRAQLRGFAEHTTSMLGFDYERGNLSIAPNAFCTTVGDGDIRMTTRPSDHLKGIVSSSLHEMGHGLYEQGSPSEWSNTPLAGGVSLAVHESQSRLWENVIGRSRGFWTRFLPDLQAIFPALGSLDVEEMYGAINLVSPEFIRVGADELTYNLHILVRFELEVELITRQLDIKDLPEAWNAKYKTYLGIEPPTNTLGCLQDVHWSRGSIGYFPTYAMGNLIGLQIWSRLQEDIPDTDARMARGEFGAIHEWLRERIYAQGRRFTPSELVMRVTGSTMRPDAWLTYATGKYRDLYGLA